MDFAQDEIDELKRLWPGVSRFDEQERTYFLLPAVALPDGCSPATVDLLLCPSERDGYPCRVFFAAVVASATGRNWNHQNMRIIDRTWHAFSWKVGDGPRRLAQIVYGFLKGLQ